MKLKSLASLFMIFIVCVCSVFVSSAYSDSKLETINNGNGTYSKVLSGTDTYLNCAPNYGWVSFTVNYRYTEDYTIDQTRDTTRFNRRRLSVSVDASRSDVSNFSLLVINPTHKSSDISFTWSPYSVFKGNEWTGKHIENSSNVFYPRNTNAYASFGISILGGVKPSEKTYTMSLATR